MFREIICIYSENHTKKILMHHGKIQIYSNVKAGGITAPQWKWTQL
jgi:hypothetical protein